MALSSVARLHATRDSAACTLATCAPIEGLASDPIVADAAVDAATMPFVVDGLSGSCVATASNADSGGCGFGGIIERVVSRGRRVVALLLLLSLVPFVAMMMSGAEGVRVPDDVIDGEGLESSSTVTVAVGVVDEETSADGVAVLLKLTDAVVSVEGVIVIVVVGVASAGTVGVLVVR